MIFYIYTRNKNPLMNDLKSRLTRETSYSRKLLAVCFCFIVFSLSCNAQNTAQWIQYEGKSGPGTGKTVVLIGGDDKYRSEGGMPMLASFLSARYGFKTTVLFPIDPAPNPI